MSDSGEKKHPASAKKLRDQHHQLGHILTLSDLAFLALVTQLLG